MYLLLIHTFTDNMNMLNKTIRTNVCTKEVKKWSSVFKIIEMF